VRIGQWTHTYRAARDAAELRFDRVDIRECVLGLGPDDFVKSLVVVISFHSWMGILR
jgi:hypothetical protein